MKLLYFVIFIAFYSAVLAQNPQREFEIKEGDKTFVMKQYIFCLLKSGPERDQDSTVMAQIQEGHLKHIDAMAEKGQVLIAGPFGDDTSLRGILIFDVATVEEAVALESTDPAVKAGRLVIECHPWWTARGGVLK